MKKWFLVKKYTHIKARVQKPYPIYDQNQRNSIPYLCPKRPKNHTLWGGTYLYSTYKGVPPPPPDSPSLNFVLFCFYALPLTDCNMPWTINLDVIRWNSGKLNHKCVAKCKTCKPIPGSNCREPQGEERDCFIYSLVGCLIGSSVPSFSYLFVESIDRLPVNA